MNAGVVEELRARGHRMDVINDSYQDFGAGQFIWRAGDPGKEGTFVIRAKFPAGYAVPAHHHPADERVAVLSGRLGYGMSDKLDKAKAKTLTAGHHVLMKADMNHWVFARSPTTIQVTGKGPFQIVYVNESDDPRKK